MPKKPQCVPAPVLLDETPSLHLGIYAEPELQLTNVSERLLRFYSYHLGDQSDLLPPRAHVLNPEVGDIRVYLDDDVWLIYYHVRFTVLVIKHSRYISGPHACRLYYHASQTAQRFWIATLQITDVMFYNEPLVLERLSAAIQAREFFIAEHSRKDLVTL